jgi:hypothetical protein
MRRGEREKKRKRRGRGGERRGKEGGRVRYFLALRFYFSSIHSPEHSEASI